MMDYRACNLPMPDRFWVKVDTSGGPDACWEWMATKSSSGYGHSWIRGRKVSAHRVSYELANGEFDQSLWVLHHCDNKLCVNPKHLFLGTALDNVLDMYAKGRQPNPALMDKSNLPKGETHPTAKLKESQVREIYQRVALGGEKERPVAREMGISRGLVGLIVAGKAWRHLKLEETYGVRPYLDGRSRPCVREKRAL